MSLDNASKIILALDVPEFKTAEKLLSDLEGTLKMVKIGSASFYRWGKKIIDLAQQKNLGLFIDFKFHDIPNTVASAVESITSWGIRMLTVHTSGGRKMLEAAVTAAHKTSERLNIPKPMVIGISVLTSIDESTLKNDLTISKSLPSFVSHLAVLAKESGLDGIVASGQEIENIRQAVGQNLKIVCPGIRSLEDTKADQKRTLSAPEAFQKGADFIVVGRPIYEAKNPRNALEEMTASSHPRV